MYFPPPSTSSSHSRSFFSHRHSSRRSRVKGGGESLSWRLVLSVFLFFFPLLPPSSPREAKGNGGKAGRTRNTGGGGRRVSVVTSANPIVDNLRLIVPLTRQARAHTHTHICAAGPGTLGKIARGEGEVVSPLGRYFIFPRLPRATAAKAASSRVTPRNGAPRPNFFGMEESLRKTGGTDSENREQGTY